MIEIQELAGKPVHGTGIKPTGQLKILRDGEYIGLLYPGDGARPMLLEPVTATEKIQIMAALKLARKNKNIGPILEAPPPPKMPERARSCDL